MRSALVGTVLLLLCGVPLRAGEVEWGLQAVAGEGAVPGVTGSFSGGAARGVWLWGGYGSGLWSPAFSEAGGGAFVGLRPVPPVTLRLKAGLGAGFHGGEAGAVRQGGVEVTWGGPGLAAAVSWERDWNWAGLSSLAASGRDVWSLGLRFRGEVE